MDELSEESKIELRKHQTELIRLIEALGSLEKSKEWETVRELVYDRSLTSIERQILQTALAPTINTDVLYRMQGEYAWAKQYNDIPRFIQTLTQQLQNIKMRLK